MKPKPFNTEYFNSIKSAPVRRYCLWLIGSPGYAYSIFNGMATDLKEGNEDSLTIWENTYPAETALFRKHIEKSTETEEIQKNLFNIYK